MEQVHIHIMKTYYIKGTLYYKDGRAAYDGQWLDDQFEGQGALYNESP